MLDSARIGWLIDEGGGVRNVSTLICRVLFFMVDNGVGVCYNGGNEGSGVGLQGNLEEIRSVLRYSAGETRFQEKISN